MNPDPPHPGRPVSLEYKVVEISTVTDEAMAVERMGMRVTKDWMGGVRVVAEVAVVKGADRRRNADVFKNAHRILVHRFGTFSSHE